MLKKYFERALFNKVILKNPEDGTILSCPLGFSFTTLISIIFGIWIVPLYRKHYLFAFILFSIPLYFTYKYIQNPIANSLYMYFIYLIYTSIIILAFFYNKYYLQSLLKKGYSVLYAPKSISIPIEQHNLSQLEIYANVYKYSVRRVIIVIIAYIVITIISTLLRLLLIVNI